VRNVKLTICDICYREKNAKKIVEATKRISVRNTQTRFAIDVCDTHQHWIRDQPKGITISDMELKFYQM